MKNNDLTETERENTHQYKQATFMKTFKRMAYLLHSAWLLRKIRHSKHEATREAAQQRLTSLLASKRGIGMKIGQAMAGMDDQSGLSELTQSAKVWPLDEIIPVLEAEWNQPVSELLVLIDESIAAASLGQVHHAKLRLSNNEDDTGFTQIAIKVQYPDIREAIASELSLAGLMPKVGPMKRWDFDLNSYQQTLTHTLQDELNYQHEMQQQQRFHREIDVDGLLVPQVYPDLSTERVLVQQWMQGERLAEAADWPHTARHRLAEILMQCLWQSLFKIGLVHGDPHPGNVLVQYDAEHPKVVLLDYGCMLDIPLKRRMALLHLIQSLRAKTTLNSFDAFIGLGFDDKKLQPIRQDLDALAAILFQPFLQHQDFNPQEWKLSPHVAQLLGDLRWSFRSACPADLFLIVRVFQGMVSQLECLGVQLSWSEMLDQALDDSYLESSLNWQLDLPAV